MNLKIKYKWFSDLDNLTKFYIIVGFITILGFLINIPMFLSWLNTPENCSEEDYQTCKEILIELQNQKINYIGTDSVLFNKSLEEKFGLTAIQIQNLANNFKEYAKTEYDKGIALAGSNDYKESIIHFNNAIELDNSNPNYYYSKAVAQYFISDFKSSLITINKSLELYDYNNVEALVVKARILEQSGKFDEAIAVYEYALYLDSDDSGLWNDMGVVLGKQQKYEEAIIYFDKALEIDEPDSIISLDCKCIALMYLQRYDEAITIYTQIINMAPDYQKAYDNRGHAYYKIGDYQSALEDWEKSLQLDGDSPFVCRLGNVGFALMQLGRTEEAIFYFQQAEYLDENFTLTCQVQ